MNHVIYRLSDNGYAKPKFPYATKMSCLKNALENIENANFSILVDETNLLQETREAIEYAQNKYGFYIHWHSAGSSAGSWREAWDYFTSLNLPKSDIVYFLEDDYLHRPGSMKIIEEGLELADYVSLYDHKDKYIPKLQGGNFFVDGTGGEHTKVLLTESTHWKITNSTTMTFAADAAILYEDVAVWQMYTMGTHPNDFMAFIELNKRGRSLVTPIPGWSTHCEPQWASPLIDWESYV